MMSAYNKSVRFCAALIAVLMIAEIIVPTTAKALTGGPVQPDISHFESVSSSGMVNNFTGDFSYNLPVINIPGAHGGGYAMSLAYNSGVKPEQEASWVGYGWTLNPGAILRGTRGYPDDYYGEDYNHPTLGTIPADNVVEYNRVKPNWTLEMGPSVSSEFASHDEFHIHSAESSVGLESIAYLNSYTGFGYRFGFDLSASSSSGASSASGSLSYARTNGNNTLTFDVGYSNWMLMLLEETINSIRGDNEHGFLSRMGQKMVGVQSSKLRSPISRYGNYYYSHTMAGNSFPSNLGSFDASSNVSQISFGASFEMAPFIGLQTRLLANWSNYSQNQATATDVWGYLYTDEGRDNHNTALDYFVEKESLFNLRDKYLSLPFSNPDQFIVSAEGLGGGFRAFNTGVGVFRPKTVESSVDVLQVGAEFGFGATISAGADFGVGYEDQRSGRWAEFDTKNSAYEFASDVVLEQCSRNPEPLFFRFNNDLGGRIEFSADDSPIQMRHPSDLVNDEPRLPDNLWPVMNQGQRSTRSSNIRMTTNEEIIAGFGDTKESEVKELNHNGFKIREKSPKGIGEFSIVTPNGANYVYGLPVYSTEEATLTFLDDYRNGDASLEHDGDVFSARLDYGAASGLTLENNRQKTLLDKEETRVVGRYQPRPYASSHLLTEIRSADYIDVGANGPDNTDIGGWVRFHYKIEHGGSEHPIVDESTVANPVPTSSWYRYRMPYTGLQYDPGSLSDPSDDRGRMQSGYRQTYYLDTIETNTHIAVFHTSPRKDGVSATEEEQIALEESAQADDDYVGDKYQQKLDKIELYAKGLDGIVDFQNEAPERTIHFEYDYSLMQGVPNADNLDMQSPNKGTDAQIGRLTLRKVWFEYQGVKPATLTAYQFNYEYPDYTVLDPNGTLRSKYPGVLEYGENLIQNPAYNEKNVDKWGNYAYNEAARKLKLKPGVNQNPDAVNFDPAAWHLKEIITPAGGSIIIQYEQDDYRYVHNQVAEILCPIYDTPLTASYGVDDENEDEARDYFYLDTESAFSAGVDLQTIRSAIQERYVDGKELMYFKFLYSINQDDLVLPDINNREFECEYLDGYVKVDNVSIVDDNGTDRLKVVLQEAPKKTCIDWYSSNAAQSRESYEARENFLSEGFFDNASAVLSLLSRSVGLAGIEFRTDACSRFHPELSYLRIPVDNRKYGGGVRVKRLLMYDAGIDESGSEVLYGNEYHYVHEDSETSSGVATNEPLAMREENPLIKPLIKRGEQSRLESLAVGKDKDEFEGPMGESLLPGPQVGYARVVVENIYSVSENGNGYAVHEYHTYNRYPMFTIKEDGKNSTFENTDHPIEHEYSYVPYLAYGSDSDENIMALQSYSFVLNAMNGRPKQMSSYGGIYGDGVDDNLNASQCYEYFEPGESVPMFYGLDKALRMEQPGKEMEVTIEARHFYRDIDRGNVEADIHCVLFSVPPFCGPSAAPSIHASRIDLHQAVSTKVVRYPVLVKSVTSLQDGIAHTTENIAFDPATGQAVITKTSDGFDGLVLGNQANPAHKGSYHHYNLKAWTHYQDMAQKSLTEGALIPCSQTVGAANVSGAVEESGSDVYLAIQPNNAGQPHVVRFWKYVKDVQIRPGDIIQATDNAGTPNTGVYHVGGVRSEIANSRIEYFLNPVAGISQGISGPSTNIAEIRILRSGRDNALGASMGSLVTYGEDKDYALKWAAELERREQITDHLNESLYDCQNVSLHSWDTPQNPSIKIESGRFGNTETWGQEHGLRFAVDANAGTITVSGHRIACYTASNPHPVVGILNDYLDNFWGTEAGWLAGVATCSNGGWDYGTTFSPPSPAVAQTVEGGMDAQVDIQIRQAIASLPAADSVCLFGATTGSLQLQDLKFKLRTESGPNRVAQDQVGYTVRESISDLQSRHAVMNLVYGPEETPFLRCFGEVVTAPIYTNCEIEWGIIPGTDRQLLQDNDNFIPDDWTYVENLPRSWDDLYNPSGGATTKFTDKIARFVQDDEGHLSLKMVISGFEKEFRYPMSFVRDVWDGNAVNTTAPGYTGELEMSKTGPGRFIITDAGQLAYVADEDDEEQDIPTLQFKSDGFPFANTMAGPSNFNNVVLAANAMTYTDSWDYELNDYVASPELPNNDYYWNKQGRFRPHLSFAVRQKTGYTIPEDGSGNITAAHEANSRSWEMGMMEQFFPFNFSDDANDFASSKTQGWFETGRITHYAPHGEVRESRDILDLPSSVAFAYDGLLPVAVAGNAALGTYWFESFEEENAALAQYSDQIAHAGKQSMEIGANDYTYDKLVYDDSWHNDGGVVRFWVQFPGLTPVAPVPQVTIEENGGSDPHTFNAELVTRMGEWNLYKCTIPKLQQSATNLGRTVTLRLSSAGGVARHIDDIRIQPFHSGMVTYVYDTEDLRLMATFDEQNFGLFYQYNAEGKLLRSIVESLAGRKTVVENYAHIPRTEDRSTIGAAQSFVGAGGGTQFPGIQADRPELDNVGKSVKSGAYHPMESSHSDELDQSSGFDFGRKFTLPDSLLNVFDREKEAGHED